MRVSDAKASWPLLDSARSEEDRVWIAHEQISVTGLKDDRQELVAKLCGEQRTEQGETRGLGVISYFDP